MEREEGSSGAGDNKTRKYPVGFRFMPTVEELVRHYLLPKLQGKPTEPNDAIIEDDVYEFHPGILINQWYRDRGEGYWYFLSPRYRKYPEKNKVSSATATEKLSSNGTVKVCVNHLVYYVGPPGRDKETKWLMNELTLPEYEIKLGGGGGMVLDRYTICKIFYRARGMRRERDLATMTTCHAAPPGCDAEEEH